MLDLSSLFLSFKCPAQNCLALEVIFIFKGLYGHYLIYMTLYNGWAVYPLSTVSTPGAIQLEKTKIIFWPVGIYSPKRHEDSADSLSGPVLKMCWGFCRNWNYKRWSASSSPPHWNCSQGENKIWGALRKTKYISSHFSHIYWCMWYFSSVTD